jgi:hypothetical protein
MMSLAMGLALLLAAEPATPRKPHPLAPSLPELTDEEEAAFDRIIDRFIEYDLGRLKGEEGKQALRDFNDLGPEAIFALIRGMNRAAAIESSCPAVVISKKVNAILRSTKDHDLLDYARENIGLGVERSRHLGILKDLKALCVVRKGQLPPKTAAMRVPPTKDKPPSAMSVAELIKAANGERGAGLKPLLLELEKRKGDEALAGLAAFTTYSETEVQQLARQLLRSNLARQDAELVKTKLTDESAPIRAAAAQVVAVKKLPLASQLIDLLADANPDVRQAARESLVQLAQGTDFGPERDADEIARAKAIENWRAWLSRPKK